MGKGGRYGKYGGHKRFARLQRGNIRDFIPAKRPDSRSLRPYPGNYRSNPPRPLKLVFRKANSSDLPFIIELSKRVFSIYGPYDKIIAGWASLAQTVTVVVEEMGQSSGFAMINLAPRAQDRTNGELLAIAIFPQYHGRGIGKKLLRYMEDLARSLSIGELFLHTAVNNEPARRFFMENGFIQRDLVDCYYPMGQKAMEMSKKLPSSP